MFSNAFVLEQHEGSPTGRVRICTDVGCDVIRCDVIPPNTFFYDIPVSTALFKTLKKCSTVQNVQNRSTDIYL